MTLRHVVYNSQWGGRPRPRRTPWSGYDAAFHAQPYTKREADAGVGRGPGGPPHNSVEAECRIP